MKFLLDTNFLLIPWMFNVDVFSLLKEFEKPEFYTLDLVITELENLSQGKGKESRLARMALLSVKNEGVEVIFYGEPTPADKALLQIAEKGFVICTQDRNLIAQLKKKKCKVITMRQKKYLKEV